MNTTRRDPRTLYLSLLAAAIVGGAAGWAIERFVPTDELASKHAAATTPIALALTSPTAEMLMAMATCILWTWGLTLLAFWFLWRVPGERWLIGRTHPIVRTAWSTSIMIFMGLSRVGELPRMASASWFNWTLYWLLALMGVVGVLAFAVQLVSSMHPLLRVKREQLQ